MTLRKMVDSTTAQDVIRTNPQMAAGYVDGRYATYAELKQALPHIPLVSLTVRGGKTEAHGCDTEPGNVGVPGAVAWARYRIENGHHASLYCMASDWPRVRAEVRRQLTWAQRKKIWYWLAEWDGKMTIGLWRRRRHVVAKQYASSDVPAGQPGHCTGHKDLSVVVPYWPGVDPAPVKSLTIISRALAKRLLYRLSKRKIPLTNKADHDLLSDVRAEITRIFNT